MTLSPRGAASSPKGSGCNYLELVSFRYRRQGGSNAPRKIRRSLGRVRGLVDQGAPPEFIEWQRCVDPARFVEVGHNGSDRGPPKVSRPCSSSRNARFWPFCDLRRRPLLRCYWGGHLDNVPRTMLIPERTRASGSKRPQ